MPSSAWCARFSANSPIPMTHAGSSTSHSAAEMTVAGGEEWRALGRGQSCGRAVPAARLQEQQRTVVRDEPFAEEALGRRVALCECAPQARPAHLAARASEPENRTLRMLDVGLADLGRDSEPVAHVRDLAERHARLRHAERARVHAEKHHTLGRRSVAPQVLAIAGRCIAQRVVDVRDRRCERERVHLAREPPRGPPEAILDRHALRPEPQRGQHGQSGRDHDVVRHAPDADGLDDEQLQHEQVEAEEEPERTRARPRRAARRPSPRRRGRGSSRTRRGRGARRESRRSPRTPTPARSRSRRRRRRARTSRRSAPT